MKNFKLLFIVCSFSLSINSIFAQEKISLENSNLWKVEHADLEKPSYIFGTLHLMCEEDFRMPEKVTRTMGEVEKLVLEINLSDPAEMQALQLTMANATKISEALSAEKFQKLDSLVQKEMGVELKAFDAYGLTTLNSLMITKMLPCEGLKSYEMELMNLAASISLPIDALETVTEQMDIMDEAFPADYAYEQLMMFEEYKKDFNAAIVLYNEEKLSETIELIGNENYMDKNAEELLLTKRNNNWVAKMPELMKEKSSLFAVGAAHLVKENGIIHLLREKGYTLTPVFK